MSTVAAQPHQAAILAALTAALPSGYGVFGAEGPTTPHNDVPYLVVYTDGGTPDGAPMDPNRQLLMSFAVRAVGVDADQVIRGSDRARAVLHAQFLPGVAGRQVWMWQDSARPVLRDDSIVPPLFEQLLMFKLRSEPA